MLAAAVAFISKDNRVEAELQGQSPIQPCFLPTEPGEVACDHTHLLLQDWSFRVGAARWSRCESQHLLELYARSMLELKNRRPLVACPDDVSTKAEKEPKLVVGDPGPVACAGGTVRSVGTAWRQLSPDLRGHGRGPTGRTVPSSEARPNAFLEEREVSNANLDFWPNVFLRSPTTYYAFSSDERSLLQCEIERTA